MARNVFVSFLGTSNYVNCAYDIDENYPVRFVQEALIRDICKDWGENDHIYIFCTDEAERVNWVDNGQKSPEEEIDKIGLESRLKGLNIITPYEKVRIEEGFSEDSIWNIFDVVYRQLQEGDHIYFDVTHAFRSIPLFSTILFNYSGFMKHTEIVAIKYGAFEKLGTAFEVRKKILGERGVAPIIDLTNIVRLQEYTEIANNLVNFGKTRKLSSKLHDGSSDSTMLDLCDALSKLDEYIATNQLYKIREGAFMAKFRCNFKPVAKEQPNPIKAILEYIKDKTSEFVTENHNKNIEVAIKWAKEHEMLLQAYSLAAEYIVLRVADHYKELNPFKKDNKGKKTYREFISQVLGMTLETFQKRDFRGVLVGHDNLIIKLWEENMIKGIRPEYDKLRKRRNSIVHGNGEFVFHDENGNDLDTDFYPIYNSCLTILEGLYNKIE